MRASAAATPGPSASLETGSASWRTRARAYAGSALCGSSQVGRPAAAQAAPVVARRGRAAGAGSGRATGGHAGQRAGAGAAGQAEQHGLGLVVAGVAEQHRGGAGRSAAASRARVAGVAGGGLGPAAAGRRRR